VLKSIVDAEWLRIGLPKAPGAFGVWRSVVFRASRALQPDPIHPRSSLPLGDTQPDPSVRPLPPSKGRIVGAVSRLRQPQIRELAQDFPNLTSFSLTGFSSHNIPPETETRNSLDPACRHRTRLPAPRGSFCLFSRPLFFSQKSPARGALPHALSCHGPRSPGSPLTNEYNLRRTATENLIFNKIFSDIIGEFLTLSSSIARTWRGAAAVLLALTKRAGLS
jgi:hypothetical protein